MSNTKIEYLYRDADNYKQWNEAVVRGELTEAQKEDILSCLLDGEYFIPGAVGLPEKRFEVWDTDSDHEWFELDASGFSTTDAEETVDLDVEELTRRFLAAKGRWETPGILLMSDAPRLHKAPDELFIYPHDEAASIVEMFEEVLEHYDISVPSPEDDERDPDNNCARLYGSVYSGLLDGVENILVELLRRGAGGARVIPHIFSGN